MVDLMKITLEPFHPHHLDELYLQPAQSYMAKQFTQEYRRSVWSRGRSWSVRSPNGNLLACSGAALRWPGNAVVWSLLDIRCSPWLLEVTRLGNVCLDFVNHHVTRLETLVETPFENGHQWVRMLGFKRVGTMHKFACDGRDFDLYERIRP